MTTTQLLHIVWQADPTAFRIGGFSMSWYGLMWGLSILLGYFMARYLYRKKGLPTAGLSTVIQYMFFGGIIGARLGDVFLYDWSYFSAHPAEILKIWKGGLASHGGAMGIFAAILLYSRKYRDVGFLQALDVATPVLLLSGGLIRIGNLMNSEIVGKPTDVLWAFVFTHYDNIPRHPSQLYDALLVFGLSALCFMLLRSGRLKTGTVAGIGLALGFGCRTLLETFKLGSDVTQLLNIPFVLLGLGMIWYANARGGAAAKVG